jgi:hypothetical protein
MELAIVFPILNSQSGISEMKNAAKLNKAAHRTAWKGVALWWKQSWRLNLLRRGTH